MSHQGDRWLDDETALDLAAEASLADPPAGMEDRLLAGILAATAAGAVTAGSATATAATAGQAASAAAAAEAGVAASAAAAVATGGGTLMGSAAVKGAALAALLGLGAGGVALMREPEPPATPPTAQARIEPAVRRAVAQPPAPPARRPVPAPPATLSGAALQRPETPAPAAPRVQPKPAPKAATAPSPRVQPQPARRAAKRPAPPATPPPSAAPVAPASIAAAHRRPAQSRMRVEPRQRPATVGSVAPSPVRVVPSDAALSAERALLAAARKALRAGHPAIALARVDAHRQRFAVGRLAEEREWLRVEALRAMGRAAEARDAAQAFLRAHPNSLYAPRVQAVRAGGR